MFVENHQLKTVALSTTAHCTGPPDLLYVVDNFHAQGDENIGAAMSVLGKCIFGSFEVNAIKLTQEHFVERYYTYAYLCVSMRHIVGGGTLLIDNSISII